MGFWFFRWDLAGPVLTWQRWRHAMPFISLLGRASRVMMRCHRIYCKALTASHHQLLYHQFRVTRSRARHYIPTSLHKCNVALTTYSKSFRRGVALPERCRSSGFLVGWCGGWWYNPVPALEGTLEALMHASRSATVRKSGEKSDEISDVGQINE